MGLGLRGNTEDVFILRLPLEYISYVQLPCVECCFASLLIFNISLLVQWLALKCSKRGFVFMKLVRVTGKSGYCHLEF